MRSRRSSASGTRPSAPVTRKGIAPAAQACGWQATGYGTGVAKSVRPNPAYSSGSR